MAIRHLPASGYVTERWKNGQGVTDEVCLLPADATRDAFDLRISRAVIAGAGPFSAFPGIERTITLIEGTGLALDFGSRIERLDPWQSLSFDSGLTPVGTPEGGPVRVLNVMGARGVWLPGAAGVVRTAVDLAPSAGGLIVVFALRGASNLGAGGETTLVMTEGDSALVDGPARLAPAKGAAALVVPVEAARVR